MNAVILVVISIVLFLVAYLFYGRYLAKTLKIDPKAVTPAHAMNDGIDYVPTKSPVLLGHHFASIAGAGPILGPIIGSAFGWMPVYLWLIVGGIFMGGVHDMTSMIASVRHNGTSIGKVIESYIGVRGKRLFMVFAYLTMILVIAVFCRIVAVTFVTVPGVASASIFFILFAIVLGLGIYRFKINLLIVSILSIILLAVGIQLGNRYPVVIYPYFVTSGTQSAITQLQDSGTITDIRNPAVVAEALKANHQLAEANDIAQAESKTRNFWVVILLIYVAIASVTPVWILLQPRDYLNSFLLYALLLGGVVGLFFADVHIVMPRYTQFHTQVGYLFPVLFVTVACGAISGFHSLVASGTTAKQLNREPDARLIGYGGMLIESLLAVVALVAAATMLHDKYQVLFDRGDFINIYSQGVGRFIAGIPALGISEQGAVTFAGLAVSAFALTTLDTCTRLARFTLQELVDDQKSPVLKSLQNRYFSTLLTVILGALFIFSGSSSAIWPVFGAANQLLASLALLAVTAWLANIRRPNWFTKIPMVFMYIVTLSAIGTLVVQNASKGNLLLSTVGVLLIILSVLLFVQAFRVSPMKNKSM